MRALLLRMLAKTQLSRPPIEEVLRELGLVDRPRDTLNLGDGAGLLANVVATIDAATTQAKAATATTLAEQQERISSGENARVALILDYYATFYRHYRLCQRTASADAHRELPDSEIKYTRDEFIDSLDAFIADWTAQEGKIRLLLPAALLVIHDEAIVKFNEFKRAVEAFTPAEPIPRKKALVFGEIEQIKSKLEEGLEIFCGPKTCRNFA